MTEAASTVVNETRFAEGLDRLSAALPGETDLIDAFAAFVRTADDRAIVRINAVRSVKSSGSRRRPWSSSSSTRESSGSSPWSGSTSAPAAARSSSG